MNSCGSTCITLWSAGIATACAASITRSTSPALTSLSRIATMPCEFRLRTWLPAIPVSTALISQPAMSSASSIARWIDCTVDSMFTTTPLLVPAIGCEPMPMTSSLSVRRNLADDRRRPSTCRCRGRRPACGRLAYPCRFLPIKLRSSAAIRHRRGRRERGVRRRAPADREAVRVTQVHVAHARQLRRERRRDDVEEA